MLLRFGALPLVCFFFFCVHKLRAELSHCQRTNLPESVLSENVINVVYTMNSSCKTCVHKASRLPVLKRYLEKKGIKTHFIIGVSHKSDRLSGLVPNIHVNHRQVWRALGKNNDHFYVIDRCGRMVYEIVNPWTDLDFPFIRSAIITAEFTHRCGLCPSDYTHVKKEEEIEEFPALEEKHKILPKDELPIKMVMKIRHMHKGDPNVYQYVVKVGGAPDYHGHLPNDKGIPRNIVTSTSQSPAVKAEDRNPKYYRQSIYSGDKYEHETTEATTTLSSINKIKNNLRNENEKVDDILNLKSVPSPITSQPPTTSQNTEIVEDKTVSYENNEDTTTVDDYYGDDSLDVDETQQSFSGQEIDKLKSHYQHILNWINYTNDYYDYENS